MNALDYWTRGNPGRLFGTWNSIGRDFDHFFRGLEEQSESSVRSLKLTCDVSESKHNYLLSFDIPGVNVEDVDIVINDNTLVISGERKQHLSHEENGYKRSERHFGHFERSFQLPEGIEVESIEAQYESGVLHLSLPKTEIKKPKKIEISTGKKGFLRNLSHKTETKTKANG